MKKKETSKLYNSITNVDDQFIEEAQAIDHKKKVKKPGWLKWGALAACLCLIIYGAFTIPNLLAPTSENNKQLDAGTLDGDPAGYGQTADIAPMICINRALYQIVGNQPDLVGRLNPNFWISCKIPTLKKSKLSHRYADKYGIVRKKSLDFFLTFSIFSVRRNLSVCRSCSSIF